jgi:hypothetical protein
VERIDRAQRDVAVSSAQATVMRDGKALLRRAAEHWAVASIEHKKEVARIVATAAGGFHLTRDGHLGLGAAEETEVPVIGTPSRKFPGKQAASLAELARALATP